MPLKNNSYDLIEQFFNFDLDETEFRHFQEEVKNDADFRKQVIRYRLMELKINDLIIPETRESRLTRHWKNLLLQKNRPVIIPQRKLLLLASSILFIGILYWVIFIWLSPFSPTTKSLAAAYWTNAPKTELASLRSTDPALNEFAPVLQLKKEERYSEALALLEQRKENLPANNLVFVLKGELLITLQQPEEAIQTLQMAIDQPELGYRDIALYYQAIAHLYLGEKKAAKQKLQTIVRQLYPNKKTAEELLNALE